MMVPKLLLVALLPLLGSAHRRCNEDEKETHPILCEKVELLLVRPEQVSHEIHDWAESHGLLMSRPPLMSLKQQRRRRLGEDAKVPGVMAHGMGDSCFNSGMQHVTDHLSELLGGAYTTCIPTGDTQAEDTTNGYFLNMDASVDVFATKVKQDPQLADGFYAIGFSQGNNVIRGYIAKYNDPPVKRFISVNGVNAGEGAVPYCRPSSLSLGFPGISMCDLLMEQASKAAYTEYSQKHSFQANYWRDPRLSEFPVYQKHAQLALWNNEGLNGVNETLKENWAKTEQFVWVMANKDNMVWPREGEQWGQPDPEHPFQKVLPREESTWFKDDLFGLKTAEEAGKNHYESFDGDHLQFDWGDFDGWVTKYLVS